MMIMPIGRLKSSVLMSLMSLFSTALVVCGCGSRQEESSPAEQSQAAVTDSLLGPAYEIEGADIRFRTPSGFRPPPDSLVQLFKRQLAASVTAESGMEMVGCFVDTTRAAVLLVSVIDRQNLTKDTAVLFDRYRWSLEDVYGREALGESTYRQGKIVVKHFRITDSKAVRFQLLCLTPEGDAAELIYMAPRAVYPRLALPIAASMASLELILPPP